VLSEAATIAEARPKLLQAICEILEWDLGAVWDVDRAAMVLRCVEVWHVPDIDIEAFEQANAETTYAPGAGLAGDVWQSGEPKWIAHLSREGDYLTAKIAVDAGMGSAFGVPIKVNGTVLHVLEFFSPHIALPDPELLQTLGVIGSQLGHLIERKAAEEALRKSEMRKAAILQSALDCIISFDLDGKIIEFNPAAERAFGYTQEEVLGRDMVDLILPDMLRDTHRRGLALFNATSVNLPTPGQRIELRALRGDRTEFPAEVSVSRIKSDGQPMFTAYLRDVTERREAERITSELAAVVQTRTTPSSPAISTASSAAGISARNASTATPPKKSLENRS
jgi:PAS domain S-box-containing protein